GADLSGADLVGADLSEADFFGADLSKGDCRDADLSEARLRGADLSETNLSDADLSRADLTGADLFEARLRGTDLSRTDLRSANLSEASLAEVDLSGVTLNRATQVEPEPLDTGKGSESGATESAEGAEKWDAVARLNHELKTAYSANGLVGQARDYRLKERKARRKEARSEGSVAGWTEAVLSLLSFIFTGYGVRLWPVVTVMFTLSLGSAAWYWWVGVENSLYYSIITFTTAPPPENPPAGTEFVSMVETFLGTLFIVLLGYVLANREQV
ncbi:MAG: pentapeptide repeat-containing protein, partial [Halobacteriales archaeon]